MTSGGYQRRILTTASISGKSSTSQGTFVNLFGPTQALGEHLSLNIGSSNNLIPRFPGVCDGSSSRKHACPSQVALICEAGIAFDSKLGLWTGILAAVVEIGSEGDLS